LTVVYYVYDLHGLIKLMIYALHSQIVDDALNRTAVISDLENNILKPELKEIVIKFTNECLDSVGKFVECVYL